MVPVQLQAQDLPVLPAHVTPEDKSKQQRAEVGKQAWKEKKRGTQREKKRGTQTEKKRGRTEELGESLQAVCGENKRRRASPVAAGR